MITIISGNPGAGKTCLLTYFLVQKLLNDGVDDWRKCNRELSTMRNGGFKMLEPPTQRHLLFSDYTVKFGRRFQSYYIDGFQIGMPNPFFKTIFIPPYSTIYLDEAQRYYDSRMSKYLREEVYRWYQLHRHNDYNIYMACQRLGNIDLNIRGIAERFIIIDNIDIKKNSWGLVTKITWKIRTFHSCDTAESYMLAKERNEDKNFGEVSEISTDLCIFDYYDSKSCKPAFYDMRYNQAFDYYTDEGYEFTVNSFIEYNNAHYFSAPQGFLKNAKYDEQILKQLGVNS